MRYSIPLVANEPTRQPLRGKCVLIKGTGAAPVVTLELVKGSEQDVENFGQVERNFSLYDADGGGFSGLILTATVNTTVDVIVTNYDARARDGDAVTATLDAAQLPLPVRTVGGATPTNRSGVLAAPNVAQDLMPANANRRGYWLQNLHATDPLWINDAGAATQAAPSMRVNAGDLYESPQGGAAVGAISIIGPLAGQSFAAREW